MCLWNFVLCCSLDLESKNDMLVNPNAGMHDVSDDRTL